MSVAAAAAWGVVSFVILTPVPSAALPWLVRGQLREMPDTVWSEERKGSYLCAFINFGKGFGVGGLLVSRIGVPGRSVGFHIMCL